MQQVLSREILWPKHIDSSHARRAYEFEGWQYRVEVVLKLSSVRQAPVPASVTIASFTDGNEFVDTVIPGPKDRRHFAESVFLLAAKLKYDLLRGILYDRAGFLHSTEIKRLNEAGLTKSQPTLYGAMGHLYREAEEPNSPEWSFFRKFFKERDQLWHLVCFCGTTAGSVSSQDLVWWLNISPENVSFLDAHGNLIEDRKLEEMLAGLFPGRCLLKVKELQEFVKRLDLGLAGRAPVGRNGLSIETKRKDYSEARTGIPPVEQSYPWQDLYLTALIQDAHIPDFIDIGLATGGKWEAKFLLKRDREQTSRVYYQASQLLGAVNPKAIIGIVGASGSGKSTILKKVAGDMARRVKEGNRKDTFPLVLRLKHFGEGGKMDIEDALQRSVIESLDILSTAELSRWDGTKVRGCRSSSTNHLRHEILMGICNEVQSWLKRDGSLSDVALFVDGVSDVSPAYEHILPAELQSILVRCYAAIVASKHMFNQLGELKFRAWLRLEPITEDQMVWYLKRKFSKKAGSIVWELKHNHARLFDLVRRPFFLKVTRDVLNREDLKNLPSTEAWLIHSFIERTSHRRLKSKETKQVNVPLARFDHCLAMVAQKLFSQIVSGNSPYVRYPSGLTDLGCESGLLDEILHLAESFGILRSSGLHFGGSADQNQITFEHDLLRDYFAALWLIETDLSEAAPMQVDSLAEFKIWDMPLKMYFELADQSNKYVDKIATRISVYDPYFAAECIEVRDTWNEQTIRDVFANLRKWELDVPCSVPRQFSKAGEWAAKVLLKRLPVKELFSIYHGEPKLTLAFVVAPEVLLANPTTSKRDLLGLIWPFYDRAHECVLRGLAAWDDLCAFALLVTSVDGIVSSGQYDLWSDEVGCLMHIVLSASSHPEFYQAKQLCSILKAEFSHQLVYFLARSSDEEINSLYSHSDPIVRAVAAFKYLEKKNDKFSDFFRQLSELGSDCLCNPLMHFLVIAVAYTYPERTEQVVVEWAKGLAEADDPASMVPKIMTILMACGTPLCCEIASDILCEANPTLVREVFSSNVPNLRGPALNLLLERLRTVVSPDIYKRALFVRFALGDSLSESELVEFGNSLQEGYVRKLIHSDEQDHEFELRLICAMIPVERNVVEIDEMDEAVLAKVAPAAAQHLWFRREYRVLSDKLANGSREDYASVFEIVSSSPHHICMLPPEALSRAIYTKCRSRDDIRIIMTVLWEKAYSLVQEARYMPAFKLVYLARQLQNETGRRWLVSVAHFPWDDLP